MANEYLSRVVSDLLLSRDVLNRALADQSFLEALSRAAAMVINALRGGGKILLAGNGGSAADAQHIAGELISRFNFDRGPLAGIALTTDTSVLTAIGNDYGYEHVFSRQVFAMGRSGDVFIAISTSGRSPNILAACNAAKARGLAVIGFTGASGGLMAGLCDVIVRVPSDSTPFIQQLHITAGHIICAITEEALFTKKDRNVE
jgi:D-sedoheptulose 7-phosphate isomerase